MRTCPRSAWAPTGGAERRLSTYSKGTGRTCTGGRILEQVISVAVAFVAIGGGSAVCGADQCLELVPEAVVSVAPVDLINASLGATTSGWGVTHIDGLVSFEKPDLVILGFGMNDGAMHRRVPAEDFAANVSRMMEAVRRTNPTAEFVLLMSMQPNKVWRSLEPMNRYLSALEKLVGPGVALADMWSMHGHLLEHKSFWDMSANALNHPNDFLARVYAQILLAVLGVE